MSIIRERGDENAERVQRARAGDPEVVFNMHDLYRVVRRMTSDQGEVEEIVQEAW